MASPKPGLSFSIVCDLGFAVGMATHNIRNIGTLIWVADPVFDEMPTLEDVKLIDKWRWPVFLPLSIYIRRKAVDRIGTAPVPKALQQFPKMRTNDFAGGWLMVEFNDGVSRSLGPAKDPDIPIYEMLNDVALKEHIVSGWYPRDDW